MSRYGSTACAWSDADLVFGSEGDRSKAERRSSGEGTELATGEALLAPFIGLMPSTADVGNTAVVARVRREDSRAKGMLCSECVR